MSRNDLGGPRVTILVCLLAFSWPSVSAASPPAQLELTPEVRRVMALELELVRQWAIGESSASALDAAKRSWFVARARALRGRIAASVATPDPNAVRRLDDLIDLLERSKSEGAGASLTLSSSLSTGSISGTVTDASTGQPLVGVEIDVLPCDSVFAVAQGITDGMGNYATPAVLEAGDYRVVTINTLGYADEVHDDVPWYGWIFSRTDGACVHVDDGGSTTGIDFALEKGGTLSGTITERGTGTPLAGNVLIWDLNHDLVAINPADASGLHAFDPTSPSRISARVLPVGLYLAVGEAPGHLSRMFDDEPCPPGFCSPFDVEGTLIEVLAEQDTSGIDFALDLGGTFSGRLTGTTADVSNFSGVLIFDAGGVAIDSVPTSNAAGDYVSSGLPSGNYFAATEAFDGIHIDELFDDVPCPGSVCDVLNLGTGISVTAGSDTPNIDFDLEAGGTFSGRISDAASSIGISPSRVSVFSAACDRVTGGFADALGDYTLFSGLPTGSYFVHSQNAQGYTDEIYANLACAGSCPEPCATGTAIAVVAGANTPNIDFALDFGGAFLSGNVVDGNDSAPLRPVFVDVFDTGGNMVTTGFTGASGDYATEGSLAAGDYFAVTRNFIGFTDELYSDAACFEGSCDPTTGTAITVLAGTEKMGIDFTLNPTDLVLFNETFTDARQFLAGRTIAVGPSVTVQSTGDLTLRAGHAVILRDGFSVAAGANFCVDIDSSLH